MIGSSPPVRGTLRHSPPPRGQRRFIPACAGNTRVAAFIVILTSVHPRLCGEHRPVDSTENPHDGSSPPVRGTLNPTVRNPQNFRFIPACAGNTQSSARLRRYPAVHPRLCGEHLPEAVARVAGTGSSPPVRGTREGDDLRGLVERFIPACAGNTASSKRQTAGNTVHPRLCGEHNVRIVVFTDQVGSSPPVRGTLGTVGSEEFLYRFIPACAGNTWTMMNCGSMPAVHPRLCGEHGPSLPMPQHVAGSSPPVRGTRHSNGNGGFPFRFIPACAGNTHHASRVGQITSVHPRLCGEHANSAPLPASSLGSSPPVRGTLEATAAEGIRARFIPACAGNTAASPG